jgi:YD repeat-containing protein
VLDARNNPNKKTVYELDRAGRVVRITDPYQKEAAYGYTGLDRTSETDKRERTTTYGDLLHHVVLVTDPEPFQTQTVVTTYDDAANRVQVSDQRSITAVTQMDPLGRVRSVIRAGIPCAGCSTTGAATRSGGRCRRQDDPVRPRRRQPPVERIDGLSSDEESLTRFGYDENGTGGDRRPGGCTGHGHRPDDVRRPEPGGDGDERGRRDDPLWLRGGHRSRARGAPR